MFLLVLAWTCAGLLVAVVYFRQCARNAPLHVAVVVLGDVGRSPRMQYHALSLARRGALVTLIGLDGTPALSALRTDPRVTLVLRHVDKKLDPELPRAAYVMGAVLRVTSQAFWLLHVLLTAPHPSALLVQTPPALPTLAVAQAIRWLRNCTLVIDWHNLGFSILALTINRKSSKIVQCARLAERLSGVSADAHLTVTEAMQLFLNDQWRISGPSFVLYDRPPGHFRRLALPEIHSFLSTLDFAQTGIASETIITRIQNGVADWAPDRPALLVSSTSWTPDEDFGVLLHALQMYDKTACDSHIGDSNQLPNIILVITGKGPLKSFYQAKIQKLNLSRVAIHLAWLEMSDYPRLLGSCDLGICLHTSSSGLDLPMKVVDMFGAGLGVAAIDYPCLGELVQDVRHTDPTSQSTGNGYRFKDANELHTILENIFCEWPRTTKLDSLRRGVAEFQQLRWEENWDAQVGPIFGLRTFNSTTPKPEDIQMEPQIWNGHDRKKK